MKNKNIFQLGFLLLIALYCGKTYSLELTISDEATYQKEYTIADLQGTWIRKQSNNTAWDNVGLKVEGNQGKLLDPMEPNLKIGDVKWLRIEKSGANTFSYQEMGSDRNYYQASIRIVSANILEIKVIHGGAGNSQKWVRKGLIQTNSEDGDDMAGVNKGVLPNLQGTWKRTSSNNAINDGIVVEINGTEGKIVDSHNSKFSNGDIKWQDIKDLKSNIYPYKELSYDGTVHSAVIEQVQDDVLQINIASTSAGNQQTWKRVKQPNLLPEDTDEMSGPAMVAQPKKVPCQITEDMVLVDTPAEVDYIVDCVIEITANLTIEEGVVIEFGKEGGLFIYDEGKLSTTGLTNKRVKLRGSQKGSGTWLGIHSEAQAYLNGTDIEGAGGNFEKAAVVIKGGKTSFNHVTITNSGGCGIYLDGYDWLNATDLEFLDNLGEDWCGKPKRITCADMIDSSTVFRDSPLEVDYIISENCVVEVTADLEIGQGTVIEFEKDAGLVVLDNGSLQVKGRENGPVTFKGKEAWKGYWKGINFQSQSTENSIEYLDISDAGGGGFWTSNKGKTSISIRDTHFTKINNLEMVNGADVGMYLGGKTSIVDFTNISVKGHKGYPISLDPKNIGLLREPFNLESNEKKYVHIHKGLIDSTTEWWPQNIPFLVDQVIDIQAQVSMLPGTELIFEEEGGLVIHGMGSLFALGTFEKKIVLKGKKDVQGYWRGIHIETNDPNNMIDFATIKNAGADYVVCCNEPAGIFLKGDGHLSLSNSLISDSGGCAVHAMEGTTLTQNDNVFNNNLGGDICTGTYPPVELPCQISEHMTLLDTPAEVDYVVPKDCLVDVNASLKIEAGVVIEFEENSGLTINNGSIFLGGEPNTKIILRGTEDRQGFWRGIHLERETYHYIQYCEIKNAGANREAAVHFENGNLDIRGTHISDSGGCAIYVEEGADLFRLNNTFSNNLLGDICDSTNPSTPDNDNILKELPCQISEDTVLKDTPAEIDYIVNCMVNVTGSLIIELGVAIEFGEGAGMVINGEKVFVTQDQNQRNVLVKSAEPKKGN